MSCIRGIVFSLPLSLPLPPLLLTRFSLFFFIPFLPPFPTPPFFSPNFSNSSLSERRSGLGLNEELSEFPADDAAVDDDDDNDAATLALQTAVNNLSQLSASVCICLF